MEPAVLLPAALGGIATGGVYALIAAALALIHGKLRLVDCTLGAGLVLAVFGLSFLILHVGFDAGAGLPVAAAVAFVGGALLQRRRAAHAGDPLPAWIAALVIAEFLALQWAAAAQTEAMLFGYDFAASRALALFGGVLGCSLLAHAVERTVFGGAVRALLAGRAPPRASLPAGRAHALAFGIACACLAAAACLMAPSSGLQAQTEGGFLPVVLALVALGARGHFRDALSGGLLVGLVEAVGRALLGDGLGLLLVLALGLALLLGHTARLFPARPPAAASEA